MAPMRFCLPVPFLGRGDGPVAEGDVVDIAIDTDPDHEPVIGPPSQGEPRPGEMPRLARHQITLSDGHQVGVAVCGQGVPLVLVHGFTAEGMLYAQTLSRLVSAGLQGRRHRHRRPRRHAGPPHRRRRRSASTADSCGRVVDELGIRKAVFAGHSMGGRLVTELAADEPRPGARRDPPRRHRRRHLGPHGRPVPGHPAAARRGRRGARRSTR